MVAAHPESSARGRLLDAGLLLFRQRGFHGVGIADVLAAAQAPKGSLYHHFPGGKTELAVAVVRSIEHGLLRMIESHSSCKSTAALVRRVGSDVSAWMRKTGDNACALLASFAAQGDSESSLREAVGLAYCRVARRFETSLQRDGFSLREARERAGLVIALFEGGGMLSHARGDPRQFSLAIEHAAQLCEPK